MADIPGIIEGASDRKRVTALFFKTYREKFYFAIYDLHADSNNIVQSYNVLLNELKKYNPELLDKSRLIAITKSDLLDGELKKKLHQNW